MIRSLTNCLLYFPRYAMASASPDNIKQWKFPEGVFLQNMSGHNAIVNTLSLNQDNVLVSGGKIIDLIGIYIQYCFYYLCLAYFWTSCDMMIQRYQVKFSASL